MIKSPILNGWFLDWDSPAPIHYAACVRNKNWFFCSGWVRKLFAVPPTAKKIQFVAYFRPSKSRVKVDLSKFTPAWGDPKYVAIPVDGTNIGFCAETISHIVKRTGKKIVYVECYYWT